MINEWYAGDLRSDTATIAEVMRGAGYATYAVGKWHVTKDIEENASRHNWPLQPGFGADMVMGAGLAQASVRLDAPLLFVGYGIQAPEEGWDDYKGVDVKGKVLVMLVNDPAPTAEAPERFGGRALADLRPRCPFFAFQGFLTGWRASGRTSARSHGPRHSRRSSFRRRSGGSCSRAGNSGARRFATSCSTSPTECRRAGH